MVARTDRHFRRLLRLITSRTLLYTEMLTAESLARRPQLASFGAEERPLILQVAGCGGDALKGAARLGEAFGYDGLNLNLGCPSARAQAGGFGACMMARAADAARAFSALAESTELPVSVKCRLGVDGQDGRADFMAFVSELEAAGCRHFVVHARKAWLRGLSPRQNRHRPPLDYEAVRRAAREFPGSLFVLNGGLAGPEAAVAASAGLGGAMLGRAVWNDPWCLREADRLLGAPAREGARDRAQVAARYLAYAESAIAGGEPRVRVLRAAARLMHGLRGARDWRRALARAARGEIAPEEVLRAMTAGLSAAHESGESEAFAQPGDGMAA